MAPKNESNREIKIDVPEQLVKYKVYSVPERSLAMAALFIGSKKSLAKFANFLSNSYPSAG